MFLYHLADYKYIDLCRISYFYRFLSFGFCVKVYLHTYTTVKVRLIRSFTLIFKYLQKNYKLFIKDITFALKNI